ncbi:E51 [Sulfolobus spindle-shaped virus Lassen]|nr:E51 [Sulfolobus spindle-shaped virus Lassen]
MVQHMDQHMDQQILEQNKFCSIRDFLKLYYAVTFLSFQHKITRGLTCSNVV